jgi:hypothetical protein
LVNNPSPPIMESTSLGADDRDIHQKLNIGCR